MSARARARQLLQDFRGDRYACGSGALSQTGRLARALGARALVIANDGGWHAALTRSVLDSLGAAGVETVGGRAFPGARPNSPREDVYRLEALILQAKPDLVVALGGGSVIDAAKAAAALAAAGLAAPSVDSLFGMGRVTACLPAGVRPVPLLAVQTAAGSAAHLTKYANVTDPAAGQKKLIIDDAIVPAAAVFDFDLLRTAPADLLADGILDGVSHNLEVFLGCPADKMSAVTPVALGGLELLFSEGAAALRSRAPAALEAIGLGTDLGGLAIMLGGTNGPHLNSFSFVDVVSHGRACGLLNPYYVVLFADAVEARLAPVAALLQNTGHIPEGSLDGKRGRALGLAVAEGLAAFSLTLGAPAALSQIPGFTPAHLERALQAACDPALESKLKNMPAPMTAADVPRVMKPLLQAAWEGRPDKVPPFAPSRPA
jgi:alcohol dehydrogenase class IV